MQQRSQEAGGERDPLTRVAARTVWDSELGPAMARARSAGEPLTVALLRVDDTPGYAADWERRRGEDLLRIFASRWIASLRGDDLLARHSDEEFSLLLPRLSADEATLVVERLRAATAGLPSFSVGIAGWDGMEAADRLMIRATAALRNSEWGGRGRVTVLAPAHDRAESWSYLIPRIIAGREIDAIYQPVHDLDGLDVVGYEALARPAGFGLLSSVDELFEAAKRLGFTRDLDWLCRRAAVHGASTLPADRSLFVNVSVFALLDVLHDVDQMLLLMRWAGRDPATVVFEIGVRDAMIDLDRLLGVVAAYRAEGFRFALDDVSEDVPEAVIAAVRPDFIKIARRLTARTASPAARAVVRSVVRSARFCGASLIAAGLENEAQVRAMRDLGVRWGQGYTFGSPETGEELALRASRSARAASTRSAPSPA